MVKKTTYAALEERVRELEERCSLLSAGVECFFVDAPAGLALYNRDLRYVRINKTLADFAGCSVAEHLGRKPSEVITAAVGKAIEEDLKRVLATGEPTFNQELCGDLPGQPGEVHYWQHSHFPIRDCKGKTIGVGAIVVEITSIKRLINDISQKELYQRMLLDNLPEKIFMKNSDLKYLYCNKNLAQDMGLAPEEMAGKDDFDFFPGNLAEKYREDDIRIMSSRRIEEIEECFQVKGEECTIHTVKAPVISCRGEVIGLLGIVHDITARKRIEMELAKYQADLERTAELQRVQEALQQAYREQEKKIAEQTRELEEKVAELVEAMENQQEMETELRESEERFRQIAENINSVVWIRNLSTEQVLYVSPAYEKIWGRTCESIYAKSDSWLEAVYPDDLEMVRAGLFLRTTRDLGIDFRIVRAGGDIRWVRAKTFMVCDQSGKKYRQVGVVENITTFMEVLNRMRESESRYRTFFETSADGISIGEISKTGDGEKKIIACNESYLKLAGRSRKEILDFADIRTLKRNRKVTQGQEVHAVSLCTCHTAGCTGQYSWLRPDGRENFIECRGSRLFINDREFFHCVHRDMTQVKLAEEKIRHLSRRIIESTEEEQRRIARDLHDEFGAILLTLRQQIDSLQMKSNSFQEGHFPELMKISEIVDVIGSAIRGATNKLRPDMLYTLGFLPALEWGLRDFADRNPAIRTSLNISGAQRKIPAEYEIALYRIAQEGLTNIGKHAEASRVSMCLTFSYPALILTVSDDGRGFTPENITEFPREISEGLGMRSMHERMLAIGGRLFARSRPGKGTVIRAEVRWSDSKEGSSHLAGNDNMSAGCLHEG